MGWLHAFFHKGQINWLWAHFEAWSSAPFGQNCEQGSSVCIQTVLTLLTRTAIVGLQVWALSGYLDSTQLKNQSWIPMSHLLLTYCVMQKCIFGEWQAGSTMLVSVVLIPFSSPFFPPPPSHPNTFPASSSVWILLMWVTHRKLLVRSSAWWWLVMLVFIVSFICSWFHINCVWLIPL